MFNHIIFFFISNLNFFLKYVLCIIRLQDAQIDFWS